MVIQSWDTANKDTELSDYSVCTTWGLTSSKVYLLDVYRAKLEFPDLKRSVKRLAHQHKARVVLVEDKASGTQLIRSCVQSTSRSCSRRLRFPAIKSCGCVRKLQRLRAGSSYSRKKRPGSTPTCTNCFRFQIAGMPIKSILLCLRWLGLQKIPDGRAGLKNRLRAWSVSPINLVGKSVLGPCAPRSLGDPICQPRRVRSH